MAQQQPGDEKGNEGNMDDEKTSSFGHYRCVFRAADDSIFLMMKDTKTKRSFSNTFSKSALLDMQLRQSTDKIIILLNKAKNGTKSELTFKIGFGDAENNKKISFGQLSKSYVKGYALYVSVAVDQEWFTAEYNFKLFEQKRNEVDILRDIIADMQYEIDSLKAVKIGGIAQFRNSGSAKTRPITWDLESVPSTIRGMVGREDSNKTIVIGIGGLYKLSASLSYTGTCSATSNHQLYINLNGSQIESGYGAAYVCGTIHTVRELKKGDKLTVGASCDTTHPTNRNYNYFMLEKI